MPSITTVLTFLTLAFFATFTLASLDEHSSTFAIASFDEHAPVYDVATASAIYARDDTTEINGFMNWYKIARDPQAKPVASINWTNQTCQNVPDVDSHWASLKSVYIAPGEGYHARCWAYIGTDCRGQQSKEFNDEGIMTSDLFGKQSVPHYSFHCACDQECIIVSGGAKARSVPAVAVAMPAWADEVN